MTLLLIALVAFAAATGIVLADSGLRLWSALGGIGGQQEMLQSSLPAQRCISPVLVTTRVSFARPAPTDRLAARPRAAA
jgi:hypothetical protein